MTSQNPRPEIYDPKTVAVMDKAFAAIWHVLRTDDPFRDYANDSELRVAIGRKLMELVANGESDPVRLGYACLSHVTNRRFPVPGYKPLGVTRLPRRRLEILLAV
jgi:hypothetical protein